MNDDKLILVWTVNRIVYKLDRELLQLFGGHNAQSKPGRLEDLLPRTQVSKPELLPYVNAGPRSAGC